MANPEWSEARELFLRKELKALLHAKRKADEDIVKDRKSAEWKVEVAAAMKRGTTVTNRWLSQALRMGHPSEVSRMVSAWIRENNA